MLRGSANENELMEDSDTLTLSRALEILPPSPIPEEEGMFEQDNETFSGLEETSVANGSLNRYGGFERSVANESVNTYSQFEETSAVDGRPGNNFSQLEGSISNGPVNNYGQVPVNYTLDHMRKRSSASMTSDRGRGRYISCN
jgi:hypothetical protein